MTGRTVAPYGSWRSPISAEMIARGSVWLAEPRPSGEATYWLETRPAEGGRHVIVRGDPWGRPTDVTPPGFSARTRVHEYGGGSYAVDRDVVFFSNDEDQRLYRQELAGAPVPITPEPATPRGSRYADVDVSPDGRLLMSVRERHAGDELPTNELVMLPADGSAEPVVVASGRDFYAFPRFSPDGGTLAWIEWDMPQMPWDGTVLKIATVADDGTLGEPQLVAGSSDESIFQPSFGPDGRLHFVSDRTGWWNIYRREADGTQTNLAPRDAEFAVPMWVFGYSTYTFLGDGRIACLYRSGGVQHLGVLDPGSGELLDLDVPFGCFEPPHIRSEGMRLVFVGGGPSTPAAIVTLDFTTRAVEVLRASEVLEIDPTFLSEPTPIEFPTAGGLTAFAIYYPPANPDFEGPPGALPPLLVHCHGGPTSEVTPELDLEKQYFTSRGFALVDVNYGGSTGFGREYRERLYGRWGIVDVDDAIAAATFLVDRGDADPDRLAINGGSAGGWTTLCALTFHDAFAAGANYFGVSDLEPFATFTHKFELRYMDQLVGKWPDAADLWHERSPVRSAERISRPLLILQGDEDEVVPPSQSELIVEALEANGVPHAYLVFEGEQHGFRKAESIVRSLEAELAFYGAVLGFEPDDDLPELEIRHLRS